MISEKQRLPHIVVAVWQRIWKNHRMYLVFSIVLSLLLGYLSSTTVWVSKSVVDYLSSSASSYVWGSLLMLLVIQISIYSLQFLRSFQDHKFNDLFLMHTELDLIDSIKNRELIEKEHPEFQGKLNVWREAASNYLNLFSTSLSLLQNLSTIGFNLIFLISTNWIAAAVVIVFSGAKAVLGFRNIESRFETIRKIQENNRLMDYYYYLLTHPDPQKEVILFGASGRIRQWWMDRRKTDYEFKTKLQLMTMKPFFSGQIISTFSVAIATCIICYYILENRLTIGDYVAITIAVTLAEVTITSMIQQIAKLMEYSKVIGYFEADQQRFEKEKSKQSAKQDYIFNRDLMISSLSFSYPNREEPALNGINLTIRKGEKVVILGHNAAGKSTLVKLILGLYEAPKNSIFYDGVPQENIDRASIWRNSTVLFQNFVHYMLTIKDNVSLGVSDGDVSEESIAEKLQFTGLPLHLFPNGAATWLGYQQDTSVNLSGGQWQRLGLARAMIRDCEIVVLDEPTSALDPNSELELFERIMDYYQAQTVLIISHRVGIAAKADKIVVMDQGKVVESGTHDELILQKGIYEDMWNKQRLWYQLA
ncbi:ATP-binding cassette subfamily B protein [Paenibacillus endophyticus]|uniref:ATP-binding cassette subfamily B protein n=1 Tax=Paenibacillus endophyticus TaxID=1294268 RepID=A0A7W5GBQ6_9BACL|nr:ABC transporter ATP-binding protein [Paenibacillus endophyticus]MBB3154061.1 ATP-binding cassette subfamily B protein [Paenibacillus endophyticus]